jgi:hypothetical protein
VISSRHADRAAKVAAGIGAETVPYNQEAETGADLIGTPAGTSAPSRIPPRASSNRARTGAGASSTTPTLS